MQPVTGAEAILLCIGLQSNHQIFTAYTKADDSVGVGWLDMIVNGCRPVRLAAAMMGGLASI